MKWFAMAGLVAVLVVSMADDSLAQRRSNTPPPPRSAQAFTPYFELSATYGSMWGGNIDMNYNSWSQSRKFRTGTGGSLGFALDYNVHPMQAIEFSYTRQDGSLDYDYQGTTTLTNMSVNFWHLGSIRYLSPGKVKPFVLFSLGATYFSPEDATIEIDGDTYYTEGTTKFSLAMGLGFKTYFGESEKIGLRASFKVLPTLYNTGGGVWFGTGGGGVTVTGNAIWQWEAAGGITVKFGGRG